MSLYRFEFLDGEKFISNEYNSLTDDVRAVFLAQKSAIRYDIRVWNQERFVAHIGKRHSG